MANAAESDGRDFGRQVSKVLSLIETGVGIGIALSSIQIIPATGVATGASCALSPTGVGALGCVLGIAGISVEFGVVAVGVTLAAHGALVLAYIGNNPPGGSGGGVSNLKKKCSTAHKVLTKYKSLSKKYGPKITANRLKQLDELRDAGEIRAVDLPGGMVKQAGFPTEWLELNLEEIAKIWYENNSSNERQCR